MKNIINNKPALFLLGVVLVIMLMSMNTSNYPQYRTKVWNNHKLVEVWVGNTLIDVDHDESCGSTEHKIKK